MSKKITITVAIAIFAALLLAAYAWLKSGITITIHESEIAEKVSQKFPLEKRHFLILPVLYSDPLVEFLDSGNKLRLGLTATPQFTVNGKSHSGSAVIRGGFRYVPERGEVYLSDFVVESIDIGDTKGISLEKLSAALSAALEDTYARHPVYRLKDDSLKQSTAKMLVRSIEIKDRAVVIHLGL